jgi:alpha-amylase/alpha-mannosidase (GH57 family)
MHQPLYKDRLSGMYLMPWVRLHGIKDYVDMPLLLEDFPKVHQTYNLVPSLLEQLEDYGHHNAQDQQLLLTTKDINAYTDEDKINILSESFHANLERQIKAHIPYYTLYMKRENLHKHGHNIASMVHEFTNQEFADMATWFNLAWFDPYWVNKKPELQKIIKEGKNFSLSTRQTIIEIQRQIIRETIPVYKRLIKSGQVEVITSPYYHPILPLLIDSNIARYPNPYTSLPERLYFHKEDAQVQLAKGLSLYEKLFGIKAKGMWPSELAVSPAALELIAKEGINWVVLDEALLTKTTGLNIFRDEHGNLQNPEVLCQPYLLNIGNEKINIVFREVVTSNEIGFSFGGRQHHEAASALYMRLKHIQQKLFNWEREGVIVIALDGENCWETYEQDGNLFLRELYKRISEDNTLKICTVSDYLERQPAQAQLHQIHSGSWISADYHIWIGDPVKNKAWDLLSQTREFLVQELSNNNYSQVKAQAWEEIYAAEGSDWFWWFGEPNNSHHDDIFDEQFRLRLQNVYKLLNKPYPEYLDISLYDMVAHKTKVH